MGHRTPDDEKADAALEDAIRASLVHYDLDMGVLTDVIVICAQQYFDDEGVPHTATAYICPGQPPHYRRLGLVEYIATRIKTEIAEPDDIGE